MVIIIIMKVIGCGQPVISTFIRVIYSRNRRTTLTMQNEILAFHTIMATVTLCIVVILLGSYKIPTRPVPRGDIISQDFSASGYVLVTYFSDQLTSGLRNIMSLQCWASSLNSSVKVVWPFLRDGSHFGFEPSSMVSDISKKKGPSFFDIVDAKTWSHFTNGRRYSALASWEEFLNKAPRKIILVDHGCKRVTQSFLDYAMKFAEDNEFEVLRRVCTSTRKKLLTSEEHKRLIYDGYKPNETVVLFRVWGGITSSLNRLKYREGPISDLQSCDLEHGHFSYYANIPPSRRIQQNGKKYIEKYLKPEKGYIAIMFRIERLFLYKKARSDADQISLGEKCINSILNEVTEWKSRGFREIFLAMDTGKYGSHRYRTNNATTPNKLSSELFNRLYSNTSLSYSEWEESFDSVADFSEAGYIGAIQQYVAANAKVLLLAGGGTFQTRALTMHKQIYLDAGGNTYKRKMCL